MKKKETEEQAVLIQWANMMCNTYKELELLYHIPNGGSRNRIEAVNLKRQGVKSGVPDLCLPSPKGKYAGMYIEMKVGKNKPSENQEKWLERLSEQGYYTTVCYGFEEAKNEILKYLRAEV